MAITRESIEGTAARIAPYIRHTPVIAVDSSDFGLTCRLILKLEMLQRTGTFKFRGAINLMLESQNSVEPIVAASGGNFAFAVGQAAATLGRKAHLFVPATSPAAKIDRVRATKAEVTVIEGFYADALEASRQHVANNGGLLAHAYDQIEVVEGAGTCGLEILAQVPEVDTVLVPVGGGGLIAGIAAALQGDANVIAIETDQTPTLYASRTAGGIVDVEVGGVAVSSLGSKRLGDIAWQITQRYVDDSILVSDDAVRQAQNALWSIARLIVEPGGSVGMASLLSGVYQPRKDETVVVVLSGANVDPASVVN
ncbi:MAG: threonine/serine dehydratase [Acidimicrobiia bacterium]